MTRLLTDMEVRALCMIPNSIGGNVNEPQLGGLSEDSLSEMKRQLEQCERDADSMSKELHHARAVCECLDNPEVLLTIPQPHRMKLSELLSAWQPLPELPEGT